MDQWTASDLEARAELSGGAFRIEAAPAGDNVVLQGRMWTDEARVGLTVVGADASVHGKLDLAERGSAGLALYLNTGDARTFGTTDDEQCIVETGSIAALVVRDEEDMRERLRDRQHLASVGITIGAGLIESLPDQDAGQLQELCSAIENGGAMRHVAGSRRLAMIGHELRQAPRHGILQGLHRETLALSFLVEAANLLHRPTCPTATHISRQIATRLDEVALLLESGTECPDLAALAQQAGMSGTSLRRHFKNRFGETLTDYARRHRLERSLIWLESGQGTIAEIAWRCGYSETTNFTTAFRRQFGFTPGQVRSAA